MSRKELLELLQRRCAELGVDLRFQTMAPDIEELAADYDLVLAADGVNSAIRARFAESFRPRPGPAQSTSTCGSAPTRSSTRSSSSSRRPSAGIMQIHGYPYSDEGSHVHRRNARGRVARRPASTRPSNEVFPPGVSDEKSIAKIRAIFADELDGHEVLSNNSKWLNFTTVRNESWRHGNVVLLGDAAHTAHFSIGSGTKLAMEDCARAGRLPARTRRTSRPR